MERKPRRPFKRGNRNKPSQQAQGIRDFTSPNGVKLRVTGKKCKRVILTLPSGVSTTFVAKRRLENRVYKTTIEREIEPDTPEKSGIFEKITPDDLFILRQEFQILKRFGWPL